MVRFCIRHIWENPRSGSREISQYKSSVVRDPLRGFSQMCQMQNLFFWCSVQGTGNRVQRYAMNWVIINFRGCVYKVLFFEQSYYERTPVWLIGQLSWKLVDILRGVFFCVFRLAQVVCTFWTILCRSLYLSVCWKLLLAIRTIEG